MKKKIDITPNLETLFGPKDENLYLIEDGLNVSIDLQSNGVQIEGTQENIKSLVTFQSSDKENMVQIALRVIAIRERVRINSIRNNTDALWIRANLDHGIACPLTDRDDRNARVRNLFLKQS